MVKSNPLLLSPVVKGIAQRHSIFASDVLMKWYAYDNIAVVVRSNNIRHLQINLETLFLDTVLAKEEIYMIDRIGQQTGNGSQQKVDSASSSQSGSGKSDLLDEKTLKLQLYKSSKENIFIVTFFPYDVACFVAKLSNRSTLNKSALNNILSFQLQKRKASSSIPIFFGLFDYTKKELAKKLIFV
ncbi:hypothetical protein RFI_03920 [Reticulomyxa filosa]|uniref:Uncharacterized protein n=1 Tax=Reticulomyxa filosa TaxID=46433 RepID=X6P6E3_RETFI|nr:hypothetical protein RFI_03920 [Reticulomyxa filosa]|eukprot:ETO33187.1 hypothetical protein RFI_03920 [Reticulomyxa filosa]